MPLFYWTKRKWRRWRRELTNEANEDFVHFQFASDPDEVSPKLIPLVSLLAHRLPSFSSTIAVRSQTKRETEAQMKIFFSSFFLSYLLSCFCVTLTHFHEVLSILMLEIPVEFYLLSCPFILVEVRSASRIEWWITVQNRWTGRWGAQYWTIFIQTNVSQPANEIDWRHGKSFRENESFSLDPDVKAFTSVFSVFSCYRCSNRWRNDRFSSRESRREQAPRTVQLMLSDRSHEEHHSLFTEEQGKTFTRCWSERWNCARLTRSAFWWSSPMNNLGILC